MDKVEMIRQEVQRVKQNFGYLPLERTELMEAYRARGVQEACDMILHFIDSVIK